MTLTIDKAGRMILPKPVRDRLGLREGSRLELLETADGLVLRHADDEPAMVKKDGMWVHMGQLPAGYDILNSVRDLQDDRIRKLAGL